jgi:uncharacterized protein
MRIREIDGFQDFLVGEHKHRGMLNEPLRYLTISHRGDVSTFSPELAGTYRRNGFPFLFGNVLHESLVNILDRIRKSDEYGEIKDGVDMCQRDCAYFSFCGGGSPSNKYFENGTFASKETSYCRIRYQYLVDGILDCIIASDEENSL